MERVRFVENTLRDGQQSIWGIGMTTAMMLPIASQLDRAGFDAIEIMGNTFFKKCVRDLHEDPWERIDLLKQRMPNTPLRMLNGRYMSLFQRTPWVSYELFLSRLVAHGVDQTRVLDASNTTDRLAERVQLCHKVGIEPIVDLIFSVSPKHTDAYFVEKTREIAKMDCTTMILKDPCGLLTPERVRTLVPLVLKHAGNKTVELHTHCTTGQGPLAMLEAVRLGIRVVHTTLPPLSDGAALPSYFNVSQNLRALGFDTPIDESELPQVSAFLKQVAEQQKLPMGTPAHYDLHYFSHQVPGGMIASFRHQLGQLGMVEKLPEVLEECARTREELGYPIMVTPYSQFVGTTAVFNVLSNERYEAVSDELILYALGKWGEEERDAIQPNVRDRILDRPRARELAALADDEPSLEEFRSRYGGSTISDDERLLWFLCGANAVQDMRAHPASMAPYRTTHSAIDLVQNAANLGVKWLELQKEDLHLTIKRH